MHTEAGQGNALPTLEVLFNLLRWENKYLELFKEKGINLKRFLELTEGDLTELGVKVTPLGNY